MIAKKAHSLIMVCDMPRFYEEKASPINIVSKICFLNIEIFRITKTIGLWYE